MPKNTVQGKLVPIARRQLRVGPRGGIQELGPGGKWRSLKEYQRRQCLAGQLVGDADGFCARLAGRRALVPHGKPYGGFSFKDGTPLPPPTPRRKWTWSKKKRASAGSSS